MTAPYSRDPFLALLTVCILLQFGEVQKLVSANRLGLRTSRKDTDGVLVAAVTRVLLWPRVVLVW